jgi:DNA replication and repair protein RecF
VTGRVETDLRSDLEIGWSDQARRVRLNDKATSGTQYLERLPVICWSAGDLKVIDGGPVDRRRFLDQGVVSRQPAAVEVLSRYRRSLEQKRELLRQGTDGLEAWNGVLAEAASDLINRRASFVEALSTSLASIIDGSGLEIPELRLAYRPSPSLAKVTAQTVFESLSQKAYREIEDRKVLVGPHRDELVISWGGVEISKVASAGEKKLVGILLCAARGGVLKQAGREPIVLLDDVDAELDPDRLLTAWRLFDSAPQIIATTCHEQVQETLSEAHVWRLDSGLLRSS